MLDAGCEPGGATILLGLSCVQDWALQRKASADEPEKNGGVFELRDNEVGQEPTLPARENICVFWGEWSALVSSHFCNRPQAPLSLGLREEVSHVLLFLPLRSSSQAVPHTRFIWLSLLPWKKQSPSPSSAGYLHLHLHFLGPPKEVWVPWLGREPSFSLPALGFPLSLHPGRAQGLVEGAHTGFLGQQLV